VSLTRMMFAAIIFFLSRRRFTALFRSTSEAFLVNSLISLALSLASGVSFRGLQCCAFFQCLLFGLLSQPSFMYPGSVLVTSPDNLKPFARIVRMPRWILKVFSRCSSPLRRSVRRARISVLMFLLSRLHMILKNFLQWMSSSPAKGVNTRRRFTLS